MSTLQNLLDDMKAGIVKKADETAPTDPPPVDQNQKSDPVALGQEMLAKIENFLQASQNAGAQIPGATDDPNAQAVGDPNAQPGTPTGDPGTSTVTLQVPANAIVKVGEEITSKDQAIQFMTTFGLLEEGK